MRSSVPKIDLDDVFEQKEEIALAVKDELAKSMEGMLSILLSSFFFLFLFILSFIFVVLYS